MPTIFLSPSSQTYNLYVGGGSEAQYMNLVADAMESYLKCSRISFNRNTISMSAADSVAESNAGKYTFHLALHSNAGGESYAGQIRGVEIYYYYNSAQGRRMAGIIKNNFREIYPLPEAVTIKPSDNLMELRRTKAPSVLVEVAYHDNPDDEAWIKGNIDAIAKTLVYSLAQYFDIPFYDNC